MENAGEILKAKKRVQKLKSRSNLFAWQSRYEQDLDKMASKSSYFMMV